MVSIKSYQQLINNVKPYKYLPRLITASFASCDLSPSLEAARTNTSFHPDEYCKSLEITGHRRRSPRSQAQSMTWTHICRGCNWQQSNSLPCLVSQETNGSRPLYQLQKIHWLKSLMASFLMIIWSGEEEEERLGMCDKSTLLAVLGFPQRWRDREACTGVVQAVKVRDTGLVTFPSLPIG